MNIRERLLEKPIVYKTFKTLILPSGAHQRIADEYFHAEDGGRVLDLGCGYGDFTPLFHPRCSYVGVDHNEGYIATARRRNPTAEFIAADVSDGVVAERGPYDLVFLSGVLHHLSDDQVSQLGRDVAPLLSEGGRFVAMEPVFDPDQSLTARLIIASDRGRFVRNERGYRDLLEGSFDSVSSEIATGLLRMPYTHAIVVGTRERVS